MNSNTPSIVVRNLQRKVPVSVAELKKVATKALKICLELPDITQTELDRLPEIAVLIVSDRKIAELHRQFMNESGPTDVITFQHGEIFVSADMARRNAKRFENSFARELGLYVIHGLLHLHGFDDRDPTNARKMEDAQQKILAKAMV